MKKNLFVLTTMLVAVTTQAQDCVTINGITWGTRNVGNPGEFVANQENYGNLYTFQEAQTVCPEGWRTPTLTEFEILNQADSKWTTVGGVSGRWFGAGDEQIFLPAFGHENHTGAALEYSYHGYYWSSSRPRTPRHFRYGLYFTRNSTYPRHANNRVSRYYVRCVRK